MRVVLFLQVSGCCEDESCQTRIRFMFSGYSIIMLLKTSLVDSTVMRVSLR
jgi:hypothetical protein